MDMKDIWGLWDRFEESSADHMELTLPGFSFVLDKHGDSASATGTEKVRTTGSRMPGQVESEKTTQAVKLVQEKEVEEMLQRNRNDLDVIKAPLVGTFYQAASPESKPFVQVGQLVRKGDVVGMIEAMKLINEITATVEGEIVEVLVQDGDLVAFDAPLFTVRRKETDV